VPVERGPEKEVHNICSCVTWSELTLRAPVDEERSGPVQLDSGCCLSESEGVRSRRRSRAGRTGRLCCVRPDSDESTDVLEAAIVAAEVARPHTGRPSPPRLKRSRPTRRWVAPRADPLPTGKYHPGPRYPRQRRRRKPRIRRRKPPQSPHLGALAWHRAAQRYGRRRTHPKHPRGAATSIPVLLHPVQANTGASTHRSGRRLRA